MVVNCQFYLGTTRLMVSRNDHSTGNDRWAFGQVLAVLLPAIPLITTLEYLFPGEAAGFSLASSPN